MNIKDIIAKAPCLSFFLVITVIVLLLGIYYRVLISNYIGYQYWRFTYTGQFQTGIVQNTDASIYYESFGEGAPLILLHGGLTSVDVFFNQIPSLAKNRRLIGIDLRGQGRSTMGEQTFTYRLLASDVIAVMDFLKVDSAEFVGWSDGGIIGLIIALEQPERIRHLVTIGANFKPEGLTQETRHYLRTTDSSRESLITRLLYWARSPHPERWQELWERVNTMWLTRPDLSLQDLARINTPTLVIIGENDNIDKNHAQAMANALVNAKLLIIPDAGHNLLIDKPLRILGEIQQYLNTQTSNPMKNSH